MYDLPLEQLCHELCNMWSQFSLHLIFFSLSRRQSCLSHHQIDIWICFPILSPPQRLRKAVLLQKVVFSSILLSAVLAGVFSSLPPLGSVTTTIIKFKTLIEKNPPEFYPSNKVIKGLQQKLKVNVLNKSCLFQSVEWNPQKFP